MNIIFYPKVHQEAMVIENYLTSLKFTMIPRSFVGFKADGSSVYVAISEKTLEYEWKIGGTKTMGLKMNAYSIKEVVDIIRFGYVQIPLTPKKNRIFYATQKMGCTEEWNGITTYSICCEET